jgi:hypothetical protein
MMSDFKEQPVNPEQEKTRKKQIRSLFYSEGDAALADHILENSDCDDNPGDEAEELSEGSDVITRSNITLLRLMKRKHKMTRYQHFDNTRKQMQQGS